MIIRKVLWVEKRGGIRREITWAVEYLRRLGYIGGTYIGTCVLRTYVGTYM